MSENRKLTPVSAAAGEGKTTLVTAEVYSPADEKKVLWLSLDDYHISSKPILLEALEYGIEPQPAHLDS